MELYTTSITFGLASIGVGSSTMTPKSQSDGGAVTYKPALSIFFQIFFFLLQPLSLPGCGSNTVSYTLSLLYLLDLDFDSNSDSNADSNSDSDF